jgi:hypothetical protein
VEMEAETGADMRTFAAPARRQAGAAAIARSAEASATAAPGSRVVRSGGVSARDERFTRENELRIGEGAAAQEWPLFGVLRALETAPDSSGESSALQFLRRMWPQAALPAGEAARTDSNPTARTEGQTFSRAPRAVWQAAASLGSGEPLSPGLRGRMEGILGHDLGEVRLHSSPIAQMLGAEAFTSGRHVVFAPGRYDPSSPRGLALLGHELTHAGLPLAFKAESSAPQVQADREEQAALGQEARVEQIIANGWPEQPPRGQPREFRHAPGSTGSQGSQSVQRSIAAAAPLSGVSFVQRAVEIDEVEVEPEGQQAAQAESSAQASGGQSGRSGATGESGAQRSGQAATGQGGAGGANIDALARQVYAILKNRLRAERERHSFYRL